MRNTTPRPAAPPPSVPPKDRARGSPGHTPSHRLRQVPGIGTSGSGPNVAAAATVTASSQNTATGQTAAKAVDGVIAGYPADPTREWATIGGKAGSYLKLAFPTAVTLNRVVLYDRPNANDQITAGTLTFSDGTTVPVPSLDNAGQATTITFTDRPTTSLRLTVTTVSGTTLNVGLSELQAYTATAPRAPAVGPMSRRRRQSPPVPRIPPPARRQRKPSTAPSPATLPTPPGNGPPSAAKPEATSNSPSLPR